MKKGSAIVTMTCIICGIVTEYQHKGVARITCSKECKSLFQKTPEYRAKLGAGKDRFYADSIKSSNRSKKLSIALMGHSVSEECIAKRLEKMRGRPSPLKGVPTGRKGTPSGRKGIPQSEEAKRKNSESNKGRVVSQETRDKIRQAHLGTKHPWSDEAKANVMAIRAAKGTPVFARNSTEEYLAKPYLKKIGYRHTADKIFVVNHPDGTRKVPDFIDYPRRRVVEIWGTYWHKDKKLPDGKRHATVEEYIEWYRTAHQGPWECIVVWDHELSEFLKGLGD